MVSVNHEERSAGRKAQGAGRKAQGARPWCTSIPYSYIKMKFFKTNTEASVCFLWWSSIVRFILLPKQGDENNSFPRMGFEPTTVAFTVRRSVKKHCNCTICMRNVKTIYHCFANAAYVRAYDNYTRMYYQFIQNVYYIKITILRLSFVYFTSHSCNSN